ncbi:hypothetical protein BBBOND_0405660 [Babesia bigemina]|uniref:Uncharacterized protein n=1 Tax=Babesia bigemina TaxID=5866 RepID=A0A061DBJ2_BABBI|nr:hypothetical protein BBBOND_0405660 [Babesia bigemina]CDR98081.1 hypothetical protein BBBOND_0405660 [Babesia bigemina]|eukprot:XP_012770267.1 hypothetical protein BBBOND_0405660 [Babesia bigemina]
MIQRVIKYGVCNCSFDPLAENQIGIKIDYSPLTISSKQLADNIRWTTRELAKICDPITASCRCLPDMQRTSTNIKLREPLRALK